MCKYQEQSRAFRVGTKSADTANLLRCRVFVSVFLFKQVQLCEPARVDSGNMCALCVERCALRVVRCALSEQLRSHKPDIINV